MDTKTNQVIVTQLSQLLRSERGMQAARDLHAMLENGGLSLDLVNWRAFLELAKGCACGYGPSVRDAIAEALNLP